MINEIITLYKVYNKTSSELVDLLNNKEYKKLKLKLNKTNGAKEVYSIIPNMQRLNLYADFKLNNWANIIQTIPHLDKKVIGYDLENNLKDYISKINGNDLIKFKFKIKEGILSLIKQDRYTYLKNNLESKVKELLHEIRKTKRICYSELTKEEINEIAIKNINGINASNLVEEYGLTSKNTVYQAKKRYKKQILEDNIDKKLINKLNKKSYKHLNKREVIEICKRNKIEKINSEELVNAYNLTNKSTVYKINKNMKNFFEGLNNLHYGPPEEVIVLDNIINLDEYRQKEIA